MTKQRAAAEIRAGARIFTANFTDEQGPGYQACVTRLVDCSGPDWAHWGVASGCYATERYICAL